MSTSFATETARPIRPRQAASSTSSSSRRRFSSTSSDSWDTSADDEEDAGAAKDAESLVIRILGRRFPTISLPYLLEERGDDVRLTEAMVRAARAHKTYEEGEKAVQMLLEHACSQQTKAFAAGAKGMPRALRRAVQTASALFGPGTNRLIILYFWGQVTIRESVLREVLRRLHEDVLEVLLGKRRPLCVPPPPATPPDAIRITEAWLSAVVASGSATLLGLLLDHLDTNQLTHNVPITARVLQTAARNEWKPGAIFELLSRRRRAELRITTDVLMAAALNPRWDTATTELLLAANRDNHDDKDGRQIRINSDMIHYMDKTKHHPNKMAEMLRTILKHDPGAVHFSAPALDALAGFPRSAVLQTILAYQPVSSRIAISQSMVEAAAANPHADIGLEIMEILLRERGDQVKVTERVLLAAIGNVDTGLRIIDLLLRKRASEICITEQLLEAAAKTRGCRYDEKPDSKLKMLLRHAKDTASNGFRVTTRMAENARVTHGEEVLLMLLQSVERHDIRITNAMIAKASTRSLEALLERSQGLDLSSFIKITNDDPQRISLLLTKLGEDERIREAVLGATLESQSYHEELLALVLAQPWKTVTLTKRVIMGDAGSIYGHAERCDVLLQQLLGKYGDEVRFARGAVEAVMECCNVDTVRLLLQLQGAGRVQVTPEIVASVARNPTWNQPETILQLLIQERKTELRLTEKVIEAAIAKTDGSFLHSLLSGVAEPGERIPCLERVVLFAAGAYQHPLWNWLFNDSDQDIQVTGRVLERVAVNGRSGDSMLRELCREYGDQIRITESVLAAAAKNPERGLAILKWLLRERGDDICITERVIEAAVTNTGRGATDILSLLLQWRPDEADVTESVLEAAASNPETGERIIDYLLSEYGDEVDISEGLLEAAVGNRENADEILGKLLARSDQPPLMTEDMLIAAFGNPRNGELLRRFSKMPGAQIQMSSRVLEAATHDYMVKELLERSEHPVWLTERTLEAYSTSRGGSFSGIIEFFVESRPSDIQLTERVVALVARFWPWAIRELLEERGDEIDITPAILEACAAGTAILHTAPAMAYLLRATRGKGVGSMRMWEVAAANEGFRVGRALLTQLLDELQSGFSVTEGMLRGAAGNREAGTEVMDFLLRHGGSTESGRGVRISERVVEIAAGNKSCGEALVDMLLQHTGDSLPLTESVTQAAAANADCGAAILELFRIRMGQ